MTLQKVFLIRHGETDYNREHRLQGALPVPLNDNGRSQAKALGLYLKNHDIEAIFSSPMIRARQTADIISQALNVTVQEESRIQEIAFGKFEGMLPNETEAEYPDEYRMWKSGDMSYTVPDGESRRAVQKRMAQAWDELTTSDAYETIALISHGSALRIIMRYLFHYVPTETIENTSLTTLSRFDEVWEIESFAEKRHLND
jgi:broad specificity phosphatase PhoE